MMMIIYFRVVILLNFDMMRSKSLLYDLYAEKSSMIKNKELNKITEKHYVMEYGFSWFNLKDKKITNPTSDIISLLDSFKQITGTIIAKILLLY